MFAERSEADGAVWVVRFEGRFGHDSSELTTVRAERCSLAGNAASTKCKDKSGNSWSYPITTYRRDKGAE
ncbi:MAG: hypothetical protein JWN48_2190 [Myxococcaceae bacterium]|nr:hypothetical protein [Myxococcaceae bacterium]